MRQTQLLSKTRKDAPKDEVARNAQLLIKAGYIYKEMAGVYAFLPLGLTVIEKIKSIVREEMQAIAAEEIAMTSLQRKELWEQTDRWDDKNVDVWFKTQLHNGTPLGLAWSHEEPISAMLAPYISSYRDLPMYVFQFQTKLRNELRSKSGILRGREFLMKDMYSFSLDENAHEAFYQKAIEAYHNVFNRVGLGDRTFLTFASGGAFTQFSHEFQTLSEVGEDTIYLHRGKRLAINEEVYTKEVLKQLDINEKDLEKVKAIETGNIFNFGDVKSKQLDLYYQDATGVKRPVILGSYGIGISRLMGTIVETFADDKGVVWPASVTPYHVHLVTVGAGESEVAQSENIYKALQKKGYDVLWDDRDESPGSKLNDADLLGIPVRVVVSKKTDGKYEYSLRSESKAIILNENEVMKKLDEFYV